MPNEIKALRSEVSANHRRVISVRMRVLEQTCLKLLDLFRGVESTLSSRSALPQEKVKEVEPLVLALRSKIARIKNDLVLEGYHQNAMREAGALVAAMTINVEELHPDYLKGYGQVPEQVAHYIEHRMGELLGLIEQINKTLGNAVTEVKPGG